MYGAPAVQELLAVKSTVGCIHVFGVFAQPNRLLALVKSAELPPEIHCRSTAISGRRSLNPTPNAISSALAGAILTCPMHPQVWQSTPGSCPICGMAWSRLSRPSSKVKIPNRLR